MLYIISLASGARGGSETSETGRQATPEITCERAILQLPCQLCCPGLLVQAKQPALTPLPKPDHASKRIHVGETRFVTAVASSLRVPCMH